MFKSVWRCPFCDSFMPGDLESYGYLECGRCTRILYKYNIHWSKYENLLTVYKCNISEQEYNELPEIISDTNEPIICPITLENTEDIGITCVGTMYDYNQINEIFKITNIDPLINLSLPTTKIERCRIRSPRLTELLRINNEYVFRNEKMEQYLRDEMNTLIKSERLQENVHFYADISCIRKYARHCRDEYFSISPKTFFMYFYQRITMRIVRQKENLSSQGWKEYNQKLVEYMRNKRCISKEELWELDQERPNDTGREFEHVFIERGTVIKFKLFKEIFFCGAHFDNVTFKSCMFSDCVFIALEGRVTFISCMIQNSVNGIGYMDEISRNVINIV